MKTEEHLVLAIHHLKLINTTDLDFCKAEKLNQVISDLESLKKSKNL